MLDKFKDECGIFGIKPHPEAANMAYLGLYALQHRGQEAAGVVSESDGVLTCSKGQGLVSDVFTREKLQRLRGDSAIGHVRYSTAGSNRIENAQPILITCQHGQIAVAHNGNLVNAMEMRRKLEKIGSIFNTDSDSEVLLHLIAKSKQETLEDAIIEALNQVEGAYSCVFHTKDKLIAVRDPRGFRPLMLGTLGESTVFASETCAFDLLDAQFQRELEPGEMVVVNRRGMRRSMKPFEEKPIRQCIFEHIYFARPDGFMFGEHTQRYREQLGAKLAEENPLEADYVIPVPDSGVSAALGYARASGIPFAFGLIRNHYVGRTFIEPKQSIRHFGVKIKLNPVRHLFEGKRVVLVDDSLVRGTTSRKIVKMVRNCGATEVHMRISAPPTTHPCYYGIDTPTRGELIASSHSIDEIRKYIEADSLEYISIQGMLDCLNNSSPESYCKACFTGDYVIPFPHQAGASV
ncbi:amidophosphoribosyltransferase [Sulfidibacter corallicola]|uniref:Amidophosphoribosyltransferase n=1 Tax=Sulfidibacter corallicola TaxID=2818388 RepID=A0A8A4TXY2_SULCO|nr:amidophosphoribosyltransferase [Sulfidibacter corallicola]QTD54068.1 amidophosphoribosyltransferase [Sulfidibacter corallicola]